MHTTVAIVCLLLWINFLPPLARLLWGERYSAPVDGGRRFFDGRPLFGSHKTWRGILFACAGSLLFVPLLPLAWYQVVVVAGLALTGDVATSFIKRRLGHEPGHSDFFLDQFLEGFFPAIYLAAVLDLAWWQVLMIVALFIPAAFYGSRLWNYLNYQPPARNFQRIVRSSVRVRQWRACHQPLARWQAWLNFENVVYYRGIMAWMFRRLGLYQRGLDNVLEIDLVEETFVFPALPRAFDGMRILLLTDLHLDGTPFLTDVIIRKIAGLEVDLCLIGGDIRMETYGPVAPSVRRLRRLVSHVRSRHGIFGVRGNHDCLEMVPALDDSVVVMMSHDSCALDPAEDALLIDGADDHHH